LEERVVKYGIVGAIALAVLVAATWDGKKKPEVAKGDPKVEAPPDSQVTGEVGSPKPGDPRFVAPQLPGPAPAPIVEPVKPAEPELLKYTIQAGDKGPKSIAKKWLGDERLAEEMCKANPRITDWKKVRPGTDLVFPRSKLGSGKASEVGTAGSTLAAGDSGGSSAVAAGLKKEEPKPSGDGEHKYVVKSGDTLYGIAARELGKGSRWKEIVKVNNLASETLKKGQTIILPEK
jgi:nucleoid-associated protein YgaU